MTLDRVISTWTWAALLLLAFYAQLHVSFMTTAAWRSNKQAYFFCAQKNGAAAGESWGRIASQGVDKKQRIKQLVRLTAVLGASFVGSQQAARAASSSSLSSLCSTETLEEVLKGNPLLDNIVVTKPNDARKFKALTLPNGLRVMLVADPSSSRSAAALDVHAGSLSDPEDIPGLAHFCEHMSFLGTKKYPEEDDFTKFLSSHGGSSNAYTDSEDTVYYFDVNDEFLADGLDRFSQFFIAPLFTESATSRELNAIDSEHAKNINNDGFRIYQLEKGGANPLHPFHKFATGNKATLETNTRAKGLDLRQALLSFHAKHYSANLMTLCIVGSQPLAKLEAWAARSFSQVPNRNVPAPATEWWGKVQPFLPQRTASLLEIVPVAESRRLTLTWPIPIATPREREELRALKPESLVSHLLGHEGKGSLRALLVEKGWANGVQAAPSADVSDAQLFEVGIELTDEGLKHRFDVVDAVFAYIDLISHDRTAEATPAIPEYIYQEVDALSRIGFNFTEKSDAQDLASSVAADMQEYTRPSQYLTGSRLFSYYPRTTQCAVSQYLSYLTPSQLRLKAIARDYEGKTKREGEWYGTPFNSVDELPAETKRWAGVTRSLFPQLAVPTRNDLLPERFELVASPPSTQKAKDEALAAPPVLIRDDTLFSIWHKTDRSFLQPRTYFIVSLAVPSTIYDAAFVMRSRLFASCFMDSINQFLYDARLAGLTMELEFTSRGVQLTLGGFSDKMPLFAERVLAALRTYKPDESTFARFKDQQLRSLAGWRTQQPYSHCSYYASIATESLQYSVTDLEAALKKLTVRSLDDFLASVLVESHGTALVQGNIDEKGASALVGLVEKTFPFSPLPENLRSMRIINEIPLAPSSASASAASVEQGYLISRPEPNTADDNSAATFYFQLSSRLAQETMLLELLAEALEQGFYNTLRTQQQLGYIVFSGLRERESIYSLVLTVQSNVLDGPGLTQRISEYLDVAIQELTALTPDAFAAFKEGIRVRKLDPDQRLTSQASRFWSEISMTPLEAPQFDRYTREVEVLDKIRQADFSTFVKQLLGRGGEKRRLLVSQVTSQIAPASAIALSSSAAQVPLQPVGDEAKFRTTLPKL